MNQGLSNRYNMSATIAGTACLLAIGLAITSGCGGSEPTDREIVTPPAPTQGAAQGSRSATTPAESGGPNLSGGLQLPDSSIPTPQPDTPAEIGEGIQMPDPADVAPEGSGEGATKTETRKSNSQVLFASWNEIQAAAETSGKVTVVDLWSLSCEPCVKEFPKLVQLHGELGDLIQCIAVDMDYDGRRTRPPEHYAERVGAFLDRVGAFGFPTYISNTPSDDVFAAMKIASLPAVLVYHADGTIAKMFVDAGDTAGFNYETDIVPLVTKLASK